MYGEALYYTQLAVNQGDGDLEFETVALVRSFSPPDGNMLQASYMTIPMCRKTESVLAIRVDDIISVVGMIPCTPNRQLQDGEEEEEEVFFAVEKPGLAVSRFTGLDEIEDDD